MDICSNSGFENSTRPLMLVQKCCDVIVLLSVQPERRDNGKSTLLQRKQIVLVEVPGDCIVGIVEFAYVLDILCPSQKFLVSVRIVPGRTKYNDIGLMPCNRRIMPTPQARI